MAEVLEECQILHKGKRGLLKEKQEEGITMQVHRQAITMVAMEG